VGRQQMHSHFLLAAVKKISNEFPILQEARREVFEDLMDIKSAQRVLELIEKKRINIEVVKTPMVSPFGLSLIMQSHTDIIKMEDRAAFLNRMHDLHLKEIERKKGILR
jgi:ATP-dependent helicase Lhr and Lhr-like helicase